jgi:uncharacterized protein (DUF486 family)
MVFALQDLFEKILSYTGFYMNMTSDLISLALRLVASNAAMMSAWFLLVPVPMVVWFAVFASHGLASIEYAIQVPANASAHEKKLGLIAMRAPQEVIMFIAFVVICIVARQTIYAQQLLAFPLVVLTAFCVLKPGISKQQLTVALAVILSACTIAVLFFRLPHIVSVTSNHLITWGMAEKLGLAVLGIAFVSVSMLLVKFVYAPVLRKHGVLAKCDPRVLIFLIELLLCTMAALFVFLLGLDIRTPALLILLIVGMCFLPNSFMIVAWYGHTQIKPNGWFKGRPKLFKYLIAWGTAFLEYSFLVPLLRFAYQYLSIFQVFGLMELSTISVFLYFAHLVSKNPDEPNLERRHMALYLSLIAIEVAFCLVG